ncbi:cell wall-binding repeat-containing protein [Clostridium sp.]|uniref:cell wall-binding repeat-containing protein n=1 Tax=Clostridium sp. TaxID=1506 RepID=UPI003D6CE21A
MRKRLLSIISIVAVSSAIFFTSNTVSAAILQDRLWGNDRYQTNFKIVNSGWTSSKYAVIASGDGFADALCAAPLAQQNKAPILLTGKDTLSTDIKRQLLRLKVEKVFVIGGTGVISDNVKSEIESMGIQTTRIYGQNRFETSVEVAKNLKDVSGVVVTTGYGFADALSISPVAAQKGMPILLTNNGDLPEITKSFLANKTFTESYIVGGTGVVSTKIESYLNNPIRLKGDSRYGTNAAVLNYFADNFSYDKVYVASGENYPDALSGSVLAASSNSPLILVGNSINASIMSSVKAQHDKYKNIIVLGGTSVVADRLATNIVSGVVATATGIVLKDTDKPLISTGLGDAPSNELWLMYSDGTEELLVSSHSAEDMKSVIASIFNPQFSLDKNKIYFMSEAWVTSASVHVVDVKTKSEHFVCSGNYLKVIQSGAYAGNLIVNQHRYYGEPNYGSYDDYYIVTPKGEEITDLGDNPEVLSQYE